jgi:hypothetical protein
MKNTTNVRIPKKKCLKMSLETVDRRRSTNVKWERVPQKRASSHKARSPDVFPRVYGTSRRPSYQISTNSNQGRRELGGGPGRQQQQPSPPPPPSTTFLGKKFSGRERCNCYSATLTQILIPNFDNLPPKNKYLALCAEIFHQKNDWGPTKHF